MTVRRAVAISAPLALLAMVNSVFAISLLPPKLEHRQQQIAGAATHVLVDAPQSWLIDPNTNENDFTGLTARAELLANMIGSPPVTDRIAAHMGVPADDVVATVRLTAGVPPVMSDPDSEQRAIGIVDSNDDYRLDLQADPYRPVIHIYAQAPSKPAALELANTAVREVTRYADEFANRDRTPAQWRAHLTQLGPARGDVINGGSVIQLALLTGLLAFSVCCWLLLLGSRVIAGWRDGGDPAATRTRRPRAAMYGGDWPRTTRVLPWMLATFMAMLWLVPFNTIQLTANLPFDLKLDRIVLPFIVATWMLALSAGGASAPRPRATWVHFAIGTFVAVACLSVVFDGQYLNHTLDLPLATKKLVLLVSYLVLFVIVSSSLRRSEVHAFMKYTLVLAVLCALGTIWEYRFHYNVFYSLSDQLLPGIFRVGSPESDTVDAMGRALTRGPAEHPLEAVAMLSLALPIALVGLIHKTDRKQTILYVVAAMIILAASVSTYRKSALLAPASVGLTLMYFRRRELLRLAPLGVVGVFFISFLSPGALGAIAEQLNPKELGVGTVSDRASDYDAIRPDVWSHLILGRGFGSYDHVSYRLLDSEVLGRLVEIGVIGLLSLGLMLVMIVAVARPYIRSRDPVWSPPALAIAAAAVAYLVVAFLFDVSSFPHTPYILMTLAGFLAVVACQPDRLDAAGPRTGETARALAERKATAPAVPFAEAPERPVVVRS